MAGSVDHRFFTSNNCNDSKASNDRKACNTFIMVIDGIDSNDTIASNDSKDSKNSKLGA